ncbi:MAG: hypothetical protein HQK53_02440 [Oligoflexia bacterium]|nr:hypothetical protein [Oligoflexia bacterium]
MNNKNRQHLWRGKWISDHELEIELSNLKLHLGYWLSQKKTQHQDTLAACDLLSIRLLSDKKLQQKLIETLVQNEVANNEVTNNALANVENIDSYSSQIMEIANFLRADNLKLKLKRELSIPNIFEDPFDLKKIDSLHGHNSWNRYDSCNTYEGWVSLGLVTHITPGNVLSVGALSVIESLLLGNINILKSATNDHFSPKILELLLECDKTNLLKDMICWVDISSKEQSTLRKLLSVSDGVVVWGGDQAVMNIRGLIGPQTRMITFGHKISFAYVSKKSTNTLANICDIARKLIIDITLLEQNACSSPQIVYLESDENGEDDHGNQSERSTLEQFAIILAEELANYSREHKLKRTPMDMEWAEITNVTELHRLETLLGKGKIFADTSAEKNWRVLLDYSSELCSSPLFRTIWVKPLSRTNIIKNLSGHRSYLQTVGLSAQPDETWELSNLFYRAGAVRIRPLGEMHNSYLGEPHDGEYALTRYARKVSLAVDTNVINRAQIGNYLSNIRSDIHPSVFSSEKSIPNILTKEGFQSQKIITELQQLTFRSGGSSGKAKVSTFSYDDYHYQMNIAADGLLAAGLDPENDRIMNLFYAGGLYGGFLSFFTILESLRAKIWPMGAFQDFSVVLDTILEFKIDTLMGTPSYLNHFFRDPLVANALKKYHGIKKIFYGGEHLASSQQEFLHQEFAVEIIKSATYGSVDAGPLGYQCAYSDGGIHHLQTKLQQLEIVGIEDNSLIPPESTAIGRLLFSSLARSGHSLLRYEIGDLGRWVQGACPCGRRAPRFELLCRYGEIFKAGGPFLHYQKILHAINLTAEIKKSDLLLFPLEMQIIILPLDGSNIDHLKIMLALAPNNSESQKELTELTKKIKDSILKNYWEFNDVYREGVITFDVTMVPAKNLVYTPNTGKLIKVIDQRK